MLVEGRRGRRRRHSEESSVFSRESSVVSRQSEWAVISHAITAGTLNRDSHQMGDTQS